MDTAENGLCLPGGEGNDKVGVGLESAGSAGSLEMGETKVVMLEAFDVRGDMELPLQLQPRLASAAAAAPAATHGGATAAHASAATHSSWKHGKQGSKEASQRLEPCLVLPTLWQRHLNCGR
jgi:hypothetical protein